MKTAALLLAFAAFASAQDELPTHHQQEPMEFEPQLQLYDIPPEKGGTTEAWAIPQDVEKAKQAADRAQKKADHWQNLQKKGVLSKVEAERAAQQANRAVYLYQQSRAASARKQVEALRLRVSQGSASSELLVSAENSLRSSEALAAEASALLQRTDLEFARIQLERQRRLAAEGLTSKRQVERAAQHLEKVKTEVSSPPATTAPAPATPQPAPAD